MKLFTRLLLFLTLLAPCFSLAQDPTVINNELLTSTYLLASEDHSIVIVVKSTDTGTKVYKGAPGLLDKVVDVIKIHNDDQNTITLILSDETILELPRGEISRQTSLTAKFYPSESSLTASGTPSPSRVNEPLMLQALRPSTHNFKMLYLNENNLLAFTPRPLKTPYLFVSENDGTDKVILITEPTQGVYKVFKGEPGQLTLHNIESFHPKQSNDNSDLLILKDGTHIVITQSTNQQASATVHSSQSMSETYRAVTANFKNMAQYNIDPSQPSNEKLSSSYLFVIDNNYFTYVGYIYKTGDNEYSFLRGSPGNLIKISITGIHNIGDGFMVIDTPEGTNYELPTKPVNLAQIHSYDFDGVRGTYHLLTPSEENLNLYVYGSDPQQNLSDLSANSCSHTISSE